MLNFLILRFFSGDCWWKLGGAILVPLLLANCATSARQKMVVSVAQQKMLLVKDGEPVALYPISTSKFGVGDKKGSYRTPLGKMEIAKKIGTGLPHGAVLKRRRFTGEVLPINAPGRDPIVTRILWLKGTENKNKNAYSRYIYIHGTPEERTIGSPASFGCIRMRSQDVDDLYDRVDHGAEVVVTMKSLPRAAAKLQKSKEKKKSQAPQNQKVETERIAETQAPQKAPPPPRRPPNRPGPHQGHPAGYETASNAGGTPGQSRGWKLSLDQARRLIGSQNRHQQVDSL